MLFSGSGEGQGGQPELPGDAEHSLPGLFPVGVGDVDNGSLAVCVHCEQKRQKLERQRKRQSPPKSGESPFG